ncbi:MAG: tetratricopeptide repeat protein [Sediminispirochaetaceae bacterium]
MRPGDGKDGKGRSVGLFLFLLFFSMLTLAGCVHSKTKLELAETHYNLGNAYAELGELEKAAQAYLRAVELDPSLRRAGYQMALVYIEAEEYGKAEEQLTSLLSKDPDNQKVKENLAWLYIRSGRDKEARDLYSEILERNPADCDVRYNLALLDAEEHAWESVRENLYNCVRYETADAEIFRLLGKAELESGGERGVEYLERAYERDSSLSGIEKELASAYRNAEQYERAVDLYDRIAGKAEDPEEAGEYYFKKAYLYFTAIEDYEQGEDDLDKALERGFSDTEELAELLSYPGLLDPERIADILEENDIELTEEQLEN